MSNTESTGPISCAVSDPRTNASRTLHGKSIAALAVGEVIGNEQNASTCIMSASKDDAVIMIGLLLNAFHMIHDNDTVVKGIAYARHLRDSGQAFQNASLISFDDAEPNTGGSP